MFLDVFFRIQFLSEMIEVTRQEICKHALTQMQHFVLAKAGATSQHPSTDVTLSWDCGRQ